MSKRRSLIDYIAEHNLSPFTGEPLTPSKPRSRRGSKGVEWKGDADSVATPRKTDSSPAATPRKTAGALKGIVNVMKSRRVKIDDTGSRLPMKITNIFSGPDLLNLSIFENFTGNPQSIERLLPIFNKRILTDGSELPGSTFCFVIWGAGDVYLNGIHIDTRETGDVFNELLLIGCKLSTRCTMVARTAMVIFECSSEEFQAGVASIPTFAKYTSDIRTNHGYNVDEDPTSEEYLNPIISALRACSYFHDTVPWFVSKLAAMLTRCLFFPQEQIPRKRDYKRNRDLLIINFGMVKKKMASGVEFMLSRHDPIDELALFGLPSETFTAFAVTTADVFILHQEVFELLVKENSISDFDDLFDRNAESMAEFNCATVLRNSPFFEHASDEFLQYVTTKWYTRLLVTGAVLDLKRHIFLLLSGQVTFGAEVYESGRLLVSRTKHLGEGKPRPVARATQGCIVKMLSYDMLLHCVSRFPNDRHHMAHAMEKYSDLELDLNGLGNVPEMLRTALSSVLGSPSAQLSFFEEVQVVAEERIFFHPEYIVEKGALGSWDTPSMFVLCSGEAEVVNADRVVASLKAPTAFGELVLLGITEERTATIRVKNNHCFCMEIKRDTLFPLLLKYPETKQMFAALAARYLVSSVCNCVDSAQIFSDIAVKFRTMVAMYSSHIVLFQETLCAQGDCGDAMFIVNNGNLIVSRNNDRVCVLIHEHCFAPHLALCGFSPDLLKDARLRTHWGSAHTEGVCSLIRISRTVMMKALDRFPQYTPWVIKKAEVEARRVLKFISQGEWRHHRRRLQQVLCNDSMNSETKLRKDILQKTFHFWKTYFTRCRLVRTTRIQQTARLHESLARWLAHHRRALLEKKAASEKKDGNGGCSGMVAAGWPMPKKSPFYTLGLPLVWNALPSYTHSIQCGDVLEARESFPNVFSGANRQTTDATQCELTEPTLLLRMAESNQLSPCSSSFQSPMVSPRKRRFLSASLAAESSQSSKRDTDMWGDIAKVGDIEMDATSDDGQPFLRRSSFSVGTAPRSPREDLVIPEHTPWGGLQGSGRETEG